MLQNLPIGPSQPPVATQGPVPAPAAMPEAPQSAAQAAEASPEDAYHAAVSTGRAQSSVPLAEPEPDRSIFPADPSPGQVTRNVSRQANPDLSLAAALVSLAREKPELISGLITARQGDKYTVNLPGHDRPLTVVQPGPVDSGTWVKVIEQAYQQTHAGDSVPADPIFMLTGHYVDLTWTERMSDDDIRTRLGTALSRDKIVSAYDGAARATWSVSAYDANTDRISLQAPDSSAKLDLSLEEFRKRFTSVTIES